MPKSPNIISDQLRAAILEADKTRYRIAQETGVTEGQLSRFVNGHGGLSLETIDKIGECLGLAVVKQPQRIKRKGK